MNENGWSSRLKNGLFNPDSVAVIGASGNPDKLGFHVLKSLIEGNFGGKIVPINPKSGKILGIESFATLSDCGEEIDLAVIVLPAQMVPGLLQECAQKGIKGIVLITAGFKEIDDPRGGQLQEEIQALANGAGIPVIGPNTFGMVNLHRSLNASFTPEFSLLERGGVALVSQSGGISHHLAFMAMRDGVGMSKIVGLGNRLNVDFEDMLDYLAGDPETRVIILYLEGLDDPRRLMEAAHDIRGRKPVLAYKTGRATRGNRASLSHTGSMAGRHDLYEGGLKQAGILTLESTEDLLDVAKALSKCPLLMGNRVAILSGQAGPGMAACDVCEEGGLKITTFRPSTQTLINEFLPPLALRTNPVDMGPAWYDSNAISGIVKAVLEDECVDGLILLMMFASANKEAVSGISPLLKAWGQKKPVVTCLLAPPGIWDRQIRELEEEGAAVNYTNPERAARTMATLWEYRRLIEV
jgi:acyl-CoA synthetase (NDP forming)